MARPWAPQKVVTPKLAVRLIESQFPPLRPARAVPLGEGWDNTVLRVNGEWVFRFPRRRIAVRLIETESRLLPVIAPRLPLAVPLPQWVGRPSEAYPWPFAGYRHLPGRTADVAAPSPDQRARAAEPLARFLSALHGLDPTEVDAPPDTLARADMGRRMPETLERLEAIAALGLVAEAKPWRRLIERTPPPPPGGGPRRLAHGDLYARHLLLDRQARPTGVIDWGDAHRGHPGVDLAVVFGYLPAPARETFWRLYPPVDEATLRLARLRALFCAAAIVVYGHDRSDKPLVREGLTALTHVLEG